MFHDEIQRTWVWVAVWAAEQLHTSEKIALHSPWPSERLDFRGTYWKTRIRVAAIFQPPNSCTS